MEYKENRKKGLGKAAEKCFWLLSWFLLFSTYSLTFLICCRGGDSFQEPELFELDHVYSVSNSSSPVAILYGALGTNCFGEFHGVLVKAAKMVLLTLKYSLLLFNSKSFLLILMITTS